MCIMDGGFRAPRPSDRRVASSRPEPAQRPADQPETTAKDMPVVTPQQRVQPVQRSTKRLKWPIIAIIILLIVAAGWFGWSRLNSGGLAIDSNKYQAVFFTNGQVYFGKLASLNKDYLKLTDIYYLQSQQNPDSDKKSENPQETLAKQDNIQLIKLGNEVHGPEDKMIISKDQILFIEDLKSDGKVTKTIEQQNK